LDGRLLPWLGRAEEAELERFFAHFFLEDEDEERAVWASRLVARAAAVAAAAAATATAGSGRLQAVYNGSLRRIWSWERIRGEAKIEAQRQHFLPFFAPVQ
jgi:hypothetical protein